MYTRSFRYASSYRPAVCDEDPCSVQGERKCSGRFEIQSLDLPTSSESEFDDDDDDITSMDTLSESEIESGDCIPLQPTPRSKLLIRKPLRRYSSSYCEDLMANESLLLRDASQEGSVASLSRQHRRTSAADSGRLSNTGSHARVVPQSTESRTLDAVRKSSSNSFVSCSTQNQLDQRRYVSSLFLPTSPLVGENMKVS